MGAFTRQFRALAWKNVLVFSQHPLLNIIRCFILPVAYGVFLAVAQIFLTKPNYYGLGSPRAIEPLRSVYDGSYRLYWAAAPALDTHAHPALTPDAIMAHLSRDFDAAQRRGLVRVDHPEDIAPACPQNFNGFSECFAAVVFNGFPAALNAVAAAAAPNATAESKNATAAALNATDPSALLHNAVNYTIQADAGLYHIDVRGRSDYERRVLPLQLALDSAIASLLSNSTLPTPLEWPFTRETNAEQATRTRLSYIRGLRTLLVLALFICYVGIAYTLPGAFGAERAALLTSHLKASGLHDAPRILSWLVTHALSYLPAWIIVALIWHARIFSATSAWLVLVTHVLLGLTLASHGLLIAVPFGGSPQLAAVVSTFGAIGAAILALVFSHASTGAAVIFSLILPGGFYVFAIRAICGWENHQITTNALRGDPDSGLVLLPILIAALVDVLVYPCLAALLERRLYDAREPRAGSSWNPFARRRPTADGQEPLQAETAISLRNLHKAYPARWRRTAVTAVADLTLDIPRHGIFVLLGSNGAGKSTTLSILGGLLGRTSGSVLFADAAPKRTDGRPAPGDVGLVPQKNVLFAELSVLQNLRVWAAVKRPAAAPEDLEQLLRDCDLGAKIHARAGTLSGGQKRKLQLAAGLVGGSPIVLVDECTSGVDPLSRRALWRILRSVRDTRTIVLTTHFLDEADLLGDTVAVLAAPGKLVAQGSPVALKAALGAGYVFSVAPPDADVLQAIRAFAPTAEREGPGAYALGSKDPRVVQAALRAIAEAAPEAEVDVRGPSLEGVFLDLMRKEEEVLAREELASEAEKDTIDSAEKDSGEPTVPTLAATPLKPATAALVLTPGRPQGLLAQARTVFYKRALIARRAWLTPALALLVAVAGACVPLVFVRAQAPGCVRRFQAVYPQSLFLPTSTPWLGVQFGLGGLRGDAAAAAPNASVSVLQAPPGVLNSTLGPALGNVSTFDVKDNTSFTSTVREQYRALELGGVSFDFAGEQDQALFAWEASPPGTTGLVLLNLVDNVLLSRATNASSPGAPPPLLAANYATFPYPATGTLVTLKWVAFFGAAMAVYPAFFSLYVSRERKAGVQAMQLSNGLANPAGMWLGHLAFDALFGLVAATLITIVFATAVNQFHGLGLFWLVMVLYGVAATLFAYCVSLVVDSPLAAFAATAGVEIVLFIVYLAAYLLVLTYAKTSNANRDITIIHFTMSLLSPVTSVMRAAFVSVNLFSLLCTGDVPVPSSAQGDIMRYGGPIVYLIGQSLFYFWILVRRESGALFRRARTRASAKERSGREDVSAEAVRVAGGEDALKVMKVSKAFEGKVVVDDVSFGVQQGTMLALLGPNGAGKTTTFNMIRGNIVPTSGQILIQGRSIISQPRAARLALGVCPQFSALDAQLSVAEHLKVYGRLKGLRPGAELTANVVAVARAAGLAGYRDRAATALSGGNQRKLALAIALMGDPAVVLIDEFSSGVDARMKREMWGTLRALAADKAVVITTHSMEEASALANKVAILAKRMLAVGTPAALEARYATYEVHFSARTREDALRAREVMAGVPGARAADDVATRFEVPVGGEGVALADLFGVLADGGLEFAVERPMLESVFLKVIREHNVEEEDEERRSGSRTLWAALKRMV